MADYIKREDAIVAAWEGSDEWDGGSNRHRDKCIEMRIRAIPAADVVPVVRCKDCKHYQHDAFFNQDWCDGRCVTPDYFCADGERRSMDGCDK